jgi:hypothetical protein
VVTVVPLPLLDREGESRLRQLWFILRMWTGHMVVPLQPKSVSLCASSLEKSVYQTQYSV